MTRGGYSTNPRAYGLDLEDFDEFPEVFRAIADAEHHNRVPPGQKFAPADFDYDPLRERKTGGTTE